jgi:hypothetical protein
VRGLASGARGVSPRVRSGAGARAPNYDSAPGLTIDPPFFVPRPLQTRSFSPGEGVSRVFEGKEDLGHDDNDC